MIIGFAGAHRTGKSTLAAKLAESAGIPFRPTNMSQVFKRVGVGVNDAMDFDTRMIVQEEMLNQMVRIFSEPGSFTTDRTPLDIIAYTYMNIPRVLTPEQIKWVQEHVDGCFEATKMLPVIVRLLPGIKIVDDPTKALSQPIYIDTLDAIIGGLAKDPRVASATYHLDRAVTDLDERVRLCGQVLQRHQAHAREIRAAAALH
jgi:hypothetical protein